MTRGRMGPALAGVLSAGLTVAASAALRRVSPRCRARWERTNHRGDPVTLLEGPALVAGTAVACLVVPDTRSTAWLGAPPASRAAGTVAVLGAGAFGALDDLHGDMDRKGLRGHLVALRHGRVTTGAVKVAGLAASGLLTSWLVDRRPVPEGGAGWSTLVGGGVVAGAANVANLLDLRPGRTLKVVVTTAVPLTAGRGGRTAAVAAGAALALLPQDLAGEAMLGDTGANAAGALIGTAALERLGLRGRVVALGLLTALTLASEKVSFTRVIESTPCLRELDALGRREPG